MDYIEISLKISFYCTKKIFHVVGRIGMLGSTGLGTHSWNHQSVSHSHLKLLNIAKIEPMFPIALFLFRSP